MQRRIFLAEQSRWEEGQASMADQVLAVDDLDAELAELMEVGQAEKVDEGHDCWEQMGMEVDEVLGNFDEQLYDFGDYDPICSSTEQADRQPVHHQTPSYVQGHDYDPTTQHSHEIELGLNSEMEDFDFDTGT